MVTYRRATEICHFFPCTREVAALFVKALAAARESLYQKRRQQVPETDPLTMEQQQAPGERYQVVHVDAEVLADAVSPASPRWARH